jgi:hypothetical protein
VETQSPEIISKKKKSKSRIRDVDQGYEAGSDEEGPEEVASEDIQSEEENPKTLSYYLGAALSRTWGISKRAALYVLWEHPVVSLLSVLTAAPSALNALAKDPSKISKEWWDAMTPLLQAQAVLNAGASLSINTIMNAFFLPTAMEKLKRSLHDAKKSPGQFIIALVEFLLGLGGALAAGAIAYSAFSWLPMGQISASAPALINFIVTWASRYIGVKNVFTRIGNFFNEDVRIQLETADNLNRLNPKYQPLVDNILHNVMDKLTTPTNKTPINGKHHRIKDPSNLTNEDYNAISSKFIKYLTQFAQSHPKLVREKTTAEYAKENAGILLDLTFASFIMGMPAFLTFMEKGWDGIFKIGEFAHADLSKLNVWLERLIGFVPGLASSLMYIDSGTKIRTTLIELAYYLHENPEHIPAALLVLAANGLSGFSPKNLSEGIVNNPHNILDLQPGTPLSTTYIITNAIAGTVVNTNASVTKAFLSGTKDGYNLTVPHLTTYLSKTNDHTVTEETLHKFRLFNRTINPPAPEEAPQPAWDTVMPVSFM